MITDADNALSLCPLRYALDIIGGKWKLPILCLLADGKPHRYNVIKKKVIGITNMMLSQSLKELEACGIVSRKQYNEIPPKVEYTLTADGKSLLPALTQLAGWGAAHMALKQTSTSMCSLCKPQEEQERVTL